MGFFVDNLVLGNWASDILAWISMWVDSLIYRVLSAFYKIFMAIVRIEFSSVNDMFDNLFNRIYIVLGLVMLFVISFNLLQILVSPDKVNDPRIGGTAMAKNIFGSLLMLIAFPLVFNLLGDAQRAIIDNNIIEKIVFGKNATSLSEEKAGPAFSWTLLSAFLHPAEGTWTASLGSTSSKVQDAYNEVWDGETYKLDQFVSVVTDTSVSYTPVVSTLVGIFIIFYLISFSLDVGVRTFKLMLLEIVAPVPIIAYMIPGKGQEVFNKYKSLYLSTYAELFTRLAIVYLALLLANKIMFVLTPAAGEVASTFGSMQLSGLSSALAQVILILALFNFARKVPDLLSGLFGVKTGGGENKGALGLLGAAGLGAAGLVGGAAVGAIGGAAGSIMRGESAGKVLSNAAGGAGRTALGAGRAGLTSRPTSLQGLRGAATSMGQASTAAIRRQGTISEANAKAGGWWNMTKTRVSAATGGEYRAKRRMDTLSNNVQAAQENYQKQQQRMAALNNIRSTAETEFAKSRGLSVSDARKHFGTTFDTRVDSWMDTQYGSNASFTRAVTDYNSEYGKNLNLTSSNLSNDLSSELTTATSNYTSAAADYARERQAKSNFENQTHGLTSRTQRTNRERLDAYDIARQRNNNGQ